LTGLLGDSAKFSWLMGFIQLKQLEEAVRKNEAEEELKRKARD